MALPHKTKPIATEQPVVAAILPKVGSLYKWVTCGQVMQLDRATSLTLTFSYVVSRTKQLEVKDTEGKVIIKADTLSLAPSLLDEALRLGRLIKIQ